MTRDEIEAKTILNHADAINELIREVEAANLPPDPLVDPDRLEEVAAAVADPKNPAYGDRIKGRTRDWYVATFGELEGGRKWEERLAAEANFKGTPVNYDELTEEERAAQASSIAGDEEAEAREMEKWEEENPPVTTSRLPQ